MNQSKSVVGLGLQGSLLTHGLINHISFSGVQVNCFLQLINIQHTYIDFEKAVGATEDKFIFMQLSA